MPKVVICISTYNRIGLLEKTLESLHESLKNDNNDVSLIIYDDCSTDKTVETLSGLAAKYSETFDTTIFFAKENKGLRVAMNWMLHAAYDMKPDYISYNQDDVTFEPKWLQECINLWENEYATSQLCGFITGHHAPEHLIVFDSSFYCGVIVKKTCRATHLFASTNRWKEFGIIPDLTPGIAAPKPGHGSKVDWWLVGHPERKYPESEKSIQNKGEFVFCIPGLVNHIGVIESTWGNTTNPEYIKTE